MKALITPVIIAAIVLMVVGGVSRLLMLPLIMESRVYAGSSALLLLLAIAIGVRELTKK